MDLEEKLKQWEQRIKEKPEPEKDPFFDSEEAKKPLHCHEWQQMMNQQTGEVVTVCKICKGVRRIQ